MLIQRPFILTRKSSNSTRRSDMSLEGRRSSPNSFSSSLILPLMAFCLLASASFSRLSMRFEGPSPQLRIFILKSAIKIIVMERNNSFTASKLFGNYTAISQGNLNDSRRRPASMRLSQRKPIFEKNMYFSSVAQYAVKRPLNYQQSSLKADQVTYDDFCGCEHNLDPCPHIAQLLQDLSERDMRIEYEHVDSISPKLSKMELKRKYFRYLPPQYPELYQAQLSNVVGNLGRDLGFNEFIALSSIQYHAKLEHITYFLFTDLQKSLVNKKKFLSNLELSLIKYEINYHELVQDARAHNLPLEAFICDYYESAGAIIIPLSRYAVFLKLLLRQGSSAKLRLLLYLIVRKKDSLLRLVQYYAKSIPYLRQQSRQLPWETFLEDLRQSN